jgi:hypothetical protein
MQVYAATLAQLVGDGAKLAPIFADRNLIDQDVVSVADVDAAVCMGRVCAGL